MHELFAVQGLFMQCVMLVLISVCAVFTVKLIAVYSGEDPVLRELIGPRGVRELLRLALTVGIAIPTGVGIARVHAQSRRTAVFGAVVSVVLLGSIAFVPVAAILVWTVVLAGQWLRGGPQAAG